MRRDDDDNDDYDEMSYDLDFPFFDFCFISKRAWCFFVLHDVIKMNMVAYLA